MDVPKPESFLSESSSFGIEQDSSTHQYMADLILGGSPQANPEQVAEIKEEEEVPEVKEQPKKKEQSTAEEPKVEITADEVLGSLETDKEQQVEPEQVVTESTEEEVNEETTYSALADHLFEYGIFTKQDEETPIVTGEDLKNRWESEKKLQVQSQIYEFLQTKHGEEGINVFNDIFVNGVNPKEYLNRYVQMEATRDLDLSIETNQEKVYREYHRRVGWTDDKIEKHLEKVKSYGDLEETTKDLHEVLLQYEEEEMQEMVEQARLQEQQRIQAEQFYAHKMSEIISDKLKTRDFDGIPVTEKVAKETKSYLVDKKYKLPTGELLTEFDKDILELRRPENYELRVKLALFLKDKGDLSKVKTKAVSKEKDELFTKVVRTNKTQNKRPSTVPQSNNFFDGL